MASFFFNNAGKLIDNGTIDLSADTIKIMLVSSSYVPTQDDDYVDLGGATGLVATEISVTNYTSGWGGAGRKTIGNKDFVADDSNNRSVVDNTANVVWTALGSGATIAAAVLIKEGTSDDTDSIPIAYMEFTTPISTNGNDFTFQPNDAGLFYRQN